MCIRDIAAEISAAENGKTAACCVMRHNRVRVRKSRGISRVEHLATVALYSRSAISFVCQTRAVLYYIFYALPRERSLRDLHDSPCAKVQADAGNGVDATRSTPDCLPAESHRLDKTSGLVRINLWAVSLPFT